MRRLPPLRALGLASVGLILLAMGTRPALLAQPADPTIAAAIVGGAFGGADEDEEIPELTTTVHLATPPMSVEATKVWLKLQEKVDRKFPNETPLEEVIKYVRKATQDKETFPSGIPIYVDPQGLHDADKTLQSPVVIDLEGVPLAKTLRLLLKQLGLTYCLQKEGYIEVTSAASDARSSVDAEAMLLDHLMALRAEVRALRREIRGRRPGGPASVGGRGGHRGPGPQGKADSGGNKGGMRNTGGMM